MNLSISVPFHGNTLYLVEHNGEVYTPMKPIVEGMGLDWKSQFEKLKQRFSKGMVEITIPTAGGRQSMLCLLLRKLTGWLYTISPNKVRPALRDKIIAYQAECDDVLWAYWSEGRKAGPPPVHQVVTYRIPPGDLAVDAEALEALRLHLRKIRESTLVVVDALAPLVGRGGEVATLHSYVRELPLVWGALQPSGLLMSQPVVADEPWPPEDVDGDAIPLTRAVVRR